ncbi:MAG TPA: carboxypeptidase-like regulatory domain-containing protein, partial [Candidatus Woesebacteria bacterium]|nr:carboxypeptidase-like regulatory domain-containing protein [Candidatus Woesebacteria bacterium]
RIRKLKSLEDIQEQQTPKMELESTSKEPDSLNQSATVKTEANQSHNTEQPPIKEEKNNQLQGTIKDSSGQAVSNALIEVFAKNEDQALRISKSNANGEFFIKTALPNGEYQIKTEAEGLVFMPISIRLTGRAVPTIEIVAE